MGNIFVHSSSYSMLNHIVLLVDIITTPYFRLLIVDFCFYPNNNVYVTSNSLFCPQDIGTESKIIMFFTDQLICSFMSLSIIDKILNKLPLPSLKPIFFISLIIGMILTRTFRSLLSRFSLGK